MWGMLKYNDMWGYQNVIICEDVDILCILLFIWLVFFINTENLTKSYIKNIDIFDAWKKKSFEMFSWKLENAKKKNGLRFSRSDKKFVNNGNPLQAELATDSRCVGVKRKCKRFDRPGWSFG